MRKLYPLLLVLVCGCGIEGINNANPKTVVRFDPSSRAVTYADNKDNDLQIDGLEFATPSGTQAKLERLVLRNNASDVRNANYQQMVGMAMQATANWQGATQMVEQLRGIIADVMPFLPAAIAANANARVRNMGITTPWGGANSTSGGLQDVAGLMPKPAPTTVPAQ